LQEYNSIIRKQFESGISKLELALKPVAMSAEVTEFAMQWFDRNYFEDIK
jgi:hypothetical protein